MLFVGRLMSYLRYLCLFAHSGVLILCFCFAFRRLVHPMLSLIVVLVCGLFE
jgi:predicted RND superfamily exporter protein